ncbi:MAG: DUF2490 domain-containing protein [Candidatus Sericytochromatia bacterium]|nr:DUF2490 domain-containing protein [Candidatus Sericytochromatia bacterium]
MTEPNMPFPSRPAEDTGAAPRKARRAGRQTRTGDSSNIDRQLAAIITLGVTLWCSPWLAAPARADVEFWNWTEWRVPLTSRAPWTGQPVHWRTFSDVRLGLRYPGLGWNFFRAGPLWTLAPWLVVGTQATVISVQATPGNYLQEYRLELEPTFLWRTGPWQFSDRNRLEHRMRWGGSGQTAHLRYRNQLRVAYAPDGASWIPFAWNEPLFEFNGEGLAQNRAEVGIGYRFNADARLDLGVMWRARSQANAWEHDGILNAYLYLAPQLRPLFDPS